MEKFGNWCGCRSSFSLMPELIVLAIHRTSPFVEKASRSWFLSFPVVTRPLSQLPA
ncbi:hypothetical protein M378DRAFT_167014, partial [Amanita muscaria Koide BX008]